MENVILIIHLILALCLIGIVLLQRSEGGGLGMGGGGNGAISGRAAATALGKMTWAFAIAFIGTSVALTVIAAQKSGNSSVVKSVNDGASQQAPAPSGSTLPSLPSTDSLLPPPTSGSSSSGTTTGSDTGTSAPAGPSAPRAD